MVVAGFNQIHLHCLHTTLLLSDLQHATVKELDPKHKELICPTLLELKRDGSVSLQAVLDELKDQIVEDFGVNDTLRNLKARWIKRITMSAALVGVDVTRTTLSWTEIEHAIQEKASTSSAYQSESSFTASSNTKRKRTNASLSCELLEEDRQRINQMLDGIDPSRFHTLQATKEEAEKRGVNAVPVELKIHQFARSCNYRHPSQALILDLDDPHWEDVFTQQELQEIYDYGEELLPALPQDVNGILADLDDLPSAIEVFNYAHRMEYDPVKEPTKLWVALTLQNVACQFFNQEPVAENALESDHFFNKFNFLATMFRGSKIKAISKEKCSSASSNAANIVRRLSAIEPALSRKIGPKMDTIFLSGAFELGCVEVGRTEDQIKEFKHSMLKMPHVLRDMLKKIVDKYGTLVHQIHLVGYCIMGNKVQMMVVDVPFGLVTRIRRTEELLFPSCNDDFGARFPSLLTLALSGKAIMERTLHNLHTAKTPVRGLRPGSQPTLPPSTLTPVSSSTSSNSAPSTSSSSTSSCTKTQRIC